MESQTILRSPRPPSWESSLCSRRSMRPHPVGVSTAKDLQLLGLLPGLVVPDYVESSICQQQAGAAGAPERTSAGLLSSYIARGGLRKASVGIAERNDVYRRHDVSYLRDKPGHGKQAKPGEWSDVMIPPSKIPQNARVIQRSTIKTGDPCYEEWYEPAERMWHRIVFPAKRPSNREQVQLLERCMTSMLTAHAGNLNRKGDKNERTKTYNSNTTTRDSPEYCDHSTSSEFTRSPYTNGDVSNEAVGDQSKSEGSVEGGLEMKGRMQGVGRAQEEGDAGKGKAGAEEKKASAIRAQMSVLMLGFYEIVRQVTQHCAERGRLLDRIWRSLNELFEYVLREMTETVDSCEQRLTAMSESLEREREDKECRDSKYRDDLRTVEELLNNRWSVKVRQLREQKARCETLVTARENMVERLREWLPNFSSYANSALAGLLPPCSAGDDKSLSPQEALEVDLQRIQTAGLWTIFPLEDWSTTSTSDSSDESESDSSKSDKTFAGGERGGGDRSLVRVRSTITRQGTAELLKVMADASSSAASRPPTTLDLNHDGPKMQQPTDIGMLPAIQAETGDTESCAARTHPEAPLSQVVAKAEELERIKKKPEEEITSDDRRKGCNRRREAWNRKFLNVLVTQGEEAKAEIEALKKEVSKVNEDKLRIVTSGKEDTKALVQECSRAQGIILSLMTDPPPSATVVFPGLLQFLGISTLTEQTSILRVVQPQSVAGIHHSVVTAVRALVVYRREAVASMVTPSTSTTTPAAGSLCFRRINEFLLEMELRRSDRVQAARATLRRLIASLLFWLPLEETGSAHRPPGFGKLPRAIAGHEKTALRQFQGWYHALVSDLFLLPDIVRKLSAKSLLQLNAGTRNHAQAVGRREGNNRMDQDGRNASSYGDGGSGACFTEAGECLWLRVFSALETYARPFRSGDRKERAPLDLVPLQRAVSAIEEIFGRGSPAEAGSSLMSTAISKKREDSKRGDMANPWRLVDRVALNDTVAAIKAAAAKHGGNHVELFDVTGAALSVGYRTNRETVLRLLTHVTEVADLAGELTFGTVSLVMHIASPGLPQSALRLLFYRAVASSHSGGALHGGKREGRSNAHKKQGGCRRQSTGGAGNVEADVMGGDAGGAGILSVAGIVSAILEFPLGCEGLVPLVAATASVEAVRNSHKQLTFQARETIAEANKVVAMIKEAQGMGAAGGSAQEGSTVSDKSIGVHVPAAEISAVEARTSQLKAFATNADDLRNALSVSRLWISCRLLTVELALLKTYGGIGQIARIQDAIKQGRRVLTRRVVRALETAWRRKLMSNPSDDASAAGTTSGGGDDDTATKSNT